MHQVSSQTDIGLSTAIAKKCIESQFPQLGKKIIIKFIGQGWDNKTYIVNNKLIFRFPCHAQADILMQQENILLKKLDCYVSLSVPKPIYFGKKNKHHPYNFHGYLALEGSSASDTSLSEAAYSNSIEQLAIFLKQLHNISYGNAIKICSKKQNFYTKNTSLLINATKELLDENSELSSIKTNIAHLNKHIESMKNIHLDQSDKILVHGDLYARHLIINENKLSAIIDWSYAGLGNIATDLAVIFSLYPEKFHSIFFDIYGEVKDKVIEFAKLIALNHSLSLLSHAVKSNDIILIKEMEASISLLKDNIK